MKTRDVAKKAVRTEISRAALLRFQQYGFDRTTVEEIAQDVGMSSRTFFRYFPSKEDVMLEPVERFKAAFLDLIERNLSSEDLWTALGNSMEEAIGRCDEDDPQHVGREMQTLIQKTPTLLARQLEIIERLQIEVTDLCMVKSANRAFGWNTGHAIVRSAFACWFANENVQATPSGNISSQYGLRDLMRDMRPRVLDKVEA